MVICLETETLNNSIEIKTIAVDYTDGLTIYDKLRRELSQLEIGMLVNNVGMAINFAQPFAQLEPEESIPNIVNCNVMSMVRMCYLVLPQMVERKRGVIVNIGSISGAFCTPLATLYGATKVYCAQFCVIEYPDEIRHTGVLMYDPVVSGLC